MGKNFITADELLGMKFGTRKSGMWPLDSEACALILNYPGVPKYGINLNCCRTSAQILDCIAQVAEKEWATAKIVGELVFTLNDFLHLQQNFCSDGAELGPRTEEGIRKIVKSSQ